PTWDEGSTVCSSAARLASRDAPLTSALEDDGFSHLVAAHGYRRRIGPCRVADVAALSLRRDQHHHGIAHEVPVDLAMADRKPHVMGENIAEGVVEVGGRVLRTNEVADRDDEREDAAAGGDRKQQVDLFNLRQQRPPEAAAQADDETEQMRVISPSRA